MLKNSDVISEHDVNALRQYNIKLLEQTKDKLANVNNIKIRVEDE